MRTTLIALVAAGALVGAVGLVLPAAADSEAPGAATAACSALPADAGPIDLGAIPVQSADGPKAIAGAGLDDQCGDFEDDDGPGEHGGGYDD